MAWTTRGAGRFMALAACALAVNGCASLNVNAYLERGANLRQYRTYAWGEADAASTGDPRLDNNTFFADRIRWQVEQQLTRHGFEKTTSGSPDLLVHYHISLSQQVDVRTLDRDYKPTDYEGPRVFVYDAGTLFVDLVDPRRHTLVWRGWAEGSFEGIVDDQAWLEARIDESVKRILERLPRL